MSSLSSSVRLHHRRVPADVVTVTAAADTAPSVTTDVVCGSTADINQTMCAGKLLSLIKKCLHREKSAASQKEEKGCTTTSKSHPGPSSGTQKKKPPVTMSTTVPGVANGTCVTGCCALCHQGMSSGSGYHRMGTPSSYPPSAGGYYGNHNVVFVPTMSVVEREVALQQERQIRRHASQLDTELNLPPAITISKDGEEGYLCSQRNIQLSTEHSKRWESIRPPPNRTIYEGDEPPPYRSNSVSKVQSGAGKPHSGLGTGNPNMPRCHSVSGHRDPRGYSMLSSGSSAGPAQYCCSATTCCVQPACVLPRHRLSPTTMAPASHPSRPTQSASPRSPPGPLSVTPRSLAGPQYAPPRGVAGPAACTAQSLKTCSQSPHNLPALSVSAATADSLSAVLVAPRSAATADSLSAVLVAPRSAAPVPSPAVVPVLNGSSGQALPTCHSHSPSKAPPPEPCQYYQQQLEYSDVVRDSIVMATSHSLDPSVGLPSSPVSGCAV